jgi:hypothetical protein
MHDARPNPYLTPCFLCGRLRCVACEVLDTRLRKAPATQVAALRARQSRHRAKYHVGQRSVSGTPPWFLDDLALQATGADGDAAARRTVAVGVLAGLCLIGLLQPGGVLLIPCVAGGVLALRLVRSQSLLARAERAFRAGRLGEALALYARAGRHDQVLACLQVRLPVWVPKAELVTAARELLALQRGLRPARAAGVSTALTASIAQEAAAATEQLWRRVDRIALVVAQRADPRTVAPALAEEAAQFVRLAEAAARARDGLALAILRGGAAELEPPRLGLELIGEQARELGRR